MEHNKIINPTGDKPRLVLKGKGLGSGLEISVFISEYFHYPLINPMLSKDILDVNKLVHGS
jgi:hypothetical protein